MVGSFFASAQPALKITKLSVAPSLPPVGAGAPEAPIGTVVAQPSGILAALLNMLGMGKTTTLTITNQRVSRVDASSNTRDTVAMPLSKGSTFHYGFRKPSVVLLLVGVMFLVTGIVAAMNVREPSTAMPGIVVGAVFVIIYFAVPRSYYMIFSSVGGLAVVLKLATKDPAELDRLCDLAFEAVRLLDEGAARARAAVA